MKVGTDGVLLGAWAPVTGVQTILDIGTGTGLIALMLAQRCHATIEAIEIDANSASQARANVDTSKFASQITIVHQSLAQYATTSAAHFDLIVCNPPYFDSGPLPLDTARQKARHAGSLAPHELMKGASKVLSTLGIVAVIVPVSREITFKTAALAEGLFVLKATYVSSREGREPERVLLAWKRTPGPKHVSHMAIQPSDGTGYTDTYSSLVKDFYLTAESDPQQNIITLP